MLKIFDISLRLNGFPIDDARKKLSEILSVPDADFKKFTDERKREIVEFHLKNNALYQSIIGDKTLENWEDLPIMKKSDLQRPLSERLSNGYSENTVFINKTSGSSGNPTVFAKNKFCHALIWANIMRRWNWHGIDYNHSLQARFYGRPLGFIAELKLKLKDILSRRYRFNIFDFSDSGMQKMVGIFRRKKFDYINGYTNSIVLLAKYLQTKNIILKNICPTLKVCITTSEMLFEEDRKMLEKQLGVPVVNEYGAAELDLIAIENQNGEWQVNAETCFVEILDDNDDALPNGSEGRIIVTLLYNKAHPMIRYDVGDIGILDEKSTAKKPILKKLVGRTNDVAILPSGMRSPGMTFYSVTKKLFDDDGNVSEFVIRQTKTDTFEIDYTSKNELADAEIMQMNQVLSDFLEPGLKFIYNRKEVSERAASGKLKQFTSLVKQD
ncbi:MAG: phenylacetate--CoA ligase family protein [Flavobacterium sp.]|nr:MAG: phenylacetate--CoA ligase family protein [Flavobacterium sp.]